VTAEPFPSGLPLGLDAGVRERRGRAGLGTGRALVGGDPPRALRLSRAGAAVLDRLRTTGAGPSEPERRLARTLVDGGLAHPRPPRTDVSAGSVTVVVPVRDRAALLGRCLAAAGVPGADVLVVDDGSRDPVAVAAVCAAHGARLVRREASGGPAAARNTALAHVDTPLIAFLDSDCVPRPGWIEALIGHFADPLVGAVAPRVSGAAGAEHGRERGAAHPPTGRLAHPFPDRERMRQRTGESDRAPARVGAVARFAAARSPLDLGARPARVAPGGRVAYVPTAALVLRLEALGDGFDPALRYGEDVDLVWRLHDAGWRVRYDPAAVVDHAEPARLPELLARRFHYGTSAAPLAARHPGRLAPFVVHPWSAAVAGLVLARRPGLAALVAGAQGAALARRLRPAGAGARDALTWPVRGAAQTLTAGGRTATMLAPPVLAAGLASRRTRPAALVLLLASPVAEWAARRPALDPVRWAVLSVADDVAYGAGVWAGAARARTGAPLRPAWGGRPGGRARARG